MVRWTRSSLFCVALLVAPTALARNDLQGPDKGAMFFSVGLLSSASKRPNKVMPGLGAELTLHGYIADGFGVGAFGQWQSMELNHNRFAGGMQFSYSLAGLELGVASEKGRVVRSTTTLLHVAPYFSIGVASLALRFGIPVGKSSSFIPGYGYDVGLVLGLKAPLPLNRR